MRKTDIHILELLLNEGNKELRLRPADIAVNIEFAKGSVRERMRPLREAGLIEYHDEQAGRYQIADRGRRYLQGDLSDDEIDDIESALS